MWTLMNAWCVFETNLKWKQITHARTPILPLNTRTTHVERKRYSWCENHTFAEFTSEEWLFRGEPKSNDGWLHELPFCQKEISNALLSTLVILVVHQYGIYTGIWKISRGVNPMRKRLAKPHKVFLGDSLCLLLLMAYAPPVNFSNPTMNILLNT